MFSNSLFLFSSKSSPNPANFTIYAPSSKTTTFKSSGISPFKNFIASITSKLLPTAFPNGSFIFVKTHTVSLLANFPISIISFANSSACLIFFINAPLPTVTSKIIFSAPLAIFLLIILDAINGILSTQEILSLNAYNFLSAGAKFNVCEIILIPMFSTFFINLLISIFVL